MTETVYTHREAWLEAAAKDYLWPLLEAKAGTEGTEPPKGVRYSCGWPRGVRKAIGQCWSPDDGIPQVFVSPQVADSVEVLGILLHELVHAAGHSGHRGGFAKVAKATGLEGKMTATVPGDELKAGLERIAAKLGPYPQTALDPNRAKKQSTRMLKASCVSTGYAVRLTRKWLDEYGPPLCACCQRTMVEG